MPKNMVGLWIQTQTLSRQGLLLLNISLIEPGYQGPLSAVLVNFGKKNVIIKPDTKIAKILFQSLDTDANKLVGEWDSDDYDTDLQDLAANAPSTFLQLQSFEKKADDILEMMKKEMKQEIKNLADKVEGQLKKDLQGDLRYTLIKWGGTTVAGLVLGCVIVWLMVSSYLPRLSEYSKFDELARRAAIVQQAETITGLNEQIQTQGVKIESLKRKLDEFMAGYTSGTQGNSSNMIPLSDRNNTVPTQ
jgi:hypothetical protein